MKILAAPTDEFEVWHEHIFRVWVGATAGGIPVRMLVCGMMVQEPAAPVFRAYAESTNKEVSAIHICPRCGKSTVDIPLTCDCPK
jgi:hypothetical protein